MFLAMSRSARPKSAFSGIKSVAEVTRRGGDGPSEARSLRVVLTVSGGVFDTSLPESASEPRSARPTLLERSVRHTPLVPTAAGP